MRHSCLTLLLLLLVALLSCVALEEEESGWLSGRDLRAQLRRRGLSCPGCVDKADVLAILRQHAEEVAKQMMVTASDGDQQLLEDFQVSTVLPEIPDGVLCEFRHNETYCVVLDYPDLALRQS
eukprot:GGOE01049243.1.p2 GENE.GGOE01049243.1~~GGOE01049243.1.p2  ORF type:complete len:135 (-),score=40.94 GGOE01049243.1:475-843(-)